ncbi:MAG: ComEC/Rec2 family competence protein [Filifactoraceae bacterium]
MRRYMSIVFSIILLISLTKIHTYNPKPLFYSSHEGYIKDLKYNSKGYNLYVDNIIISNFGEPVGLHLGDKIHVQGKFQDVLSLDSTGFGQYLKGRGCSYIINSGKITALSQVNDHPSLKYSSIIWIDKKLDELYGQHSFFPKALIHGYPLDKNILESFRISGTAHILALSGFHVGFIILFLNIFLQPIPIRTRMIIICVLLSLYAYITGARASIVRSVSFFMLYYVSILNKRRFDILSAVMLITSIMMALNPFILYDMGFVLSFMCVSSIAMFYPMLKRLNLIPSNSGEILSYIYKLILVTISAQILPLPYMVYNFGKIPLISIPSNLLTLPLISLMMTLIILSLTFSILFPLARLLADLGVIIMNIILNINIYISKLSFASTKITLSKNTAIVLSLLILGTYFIYEKWRIQENKYEL